MKTTLTNKEWLKYRNREMGDLLIRKSKKLDDGEYAKSIILDPLGQVFPFQCSCGVKHQFSYIETQEGLRVLSLK